MIKLIACDLDGTLMPPSKILPEKTFPLIEKLYGRGVIFAPASGRQLPNLKKVFAPVLDKIAIIAENGGLVWHGGKIVFCDPTPSEGAARAVKAVRTVDGLYPVISCAERAYYEDDYPPFLEKLGASFSSTERVPDLEKVAFENEVIKVSVWDDFPASEHGGVVLPPMLEGLRTMISGRDWLDVSAPHANKGRALNALMTRLGVSAEQCTAFGDHMNDYEMLKVSGHPFVTANAYPPLKALIGEEIPSNADFGVIKKLEEILCDL